MKVKTFFKMTDGLTEVMSSIDDKINEWLKEVETESNGPIEVQFVKQSIAPRDDGETTILISVFYTTPHAIECL